MERDITAVFEHLSVPWKPPATTSIGVAELFAVFVLVWFDATALISTKRRRMLENPNLDVPSFGAANWSENSTICENVWCKVIHIFFLHTF